MAYEFAREVLSPTEAEEDSIPLLSPQSAGRHGEIPVIVWLASFEEEIGELMKAARARGLEFPEVFIPGVGYMPHANEDPAPLTRSHPSCSG